MSAYQQLSNCAKWFVFLVAALLLASCGGGGGSEQKTAANNENLAASGYVASLSETEISQITSKANLVAAVSTIQPCKFMQIGSVVRCLLPTTGYYSIGTGVGLASEIPNCTSVEIGGTASAVIPSANGRACFQFVVAGSSATPLVSEVKLPDGMSGIAELYVEFPNTAALKMTDDLSGSNPLTVTVTPNQEMRLVVMVTAENSVGGEPVLIGVGAPAESPENSTPNQAKQLAMNKVVSSFAPLSAVTDRYYFYALQNNQTSAELLATFPAGLEVSYRYAQKDSSNNYTLQDEIFIDNSESGVSKQISGLTPSSSADISNGIMFHVRAPSASQASQAFSLRVGVGVAYVSYATLSNTENLNTYEQTLGITKAYSYLDMAVNVKDGNNNPVEGETVKFRVFADKADKLTFITQTVQTDSLGNASYSAHFPVCLGVDKNVPNLVYSVPGDHWLMNGQQGSVEVSLPNSISISSNPDNTKNSKVFYKICSERYVGRY